MAEEINSDIVEAEPAIIKAYVDGLTGSTLNQVSIEIYGQKALVTVNIDNP